MQPVRSFWQPALTSSGGHFFVHCETPGCPLYFATREVSDWLTMDLDQWNAVQHPKWVAPKNLLQVA
jgi:hypothetical protein